MLRKLRQWLNVKTWDQTHTPYVPEVDPQLQTELAAKANLDGSTNKVYLELDRQIREREIGGIEAMTMFMQFGCDSLVSLPAVAAYEFTPEITDEEQRMLDEQMKKELPSDSFLPPIGDLTTTRKTGYQATYAFPPATLLPGEAPEDCGWTGITTRENSKGEKLTWRHPIPPKSALWRPPKLTPTEDAAVKLVEQYAQVSKHVIDLPSPKLKPALKKKKADVDKGYRRVVIDAKGKFKEVKEPKQ